MQFKELMIHLIGIYSISISRFKQNKMYAYDWFILAHNLKSLFNITI